MRETDMKEKEQQLPVLHIVLANEEYHFSFPPGKSVYEILAPTNIRIRFVCGGIGTCGQCRIWVETGVVNEPTNNELDKLPPEQIRQGARLAFQVRPLQDVRIRIEKPASRSSWRNLAQDEYTPIQLPVQNIPAVKQNRHLYGAAVDLGTTQIRISLWDRDKRQRLAGRSGLNLQGAAWELMCSREC